MLVVFSSTIQYLLAALWADRWSVCVECVCLWVISSQSVGRTTSVLQQHVLVQECARGCGKTHQCVFATKWMIACIWGFVCVCGGGYRLLYLTLYVFISLRQMACVCTAQIFKTPQNFFLCAYTHNTHVCLWPTDGNSCNFLCKPTHLW